MCGLTAIFDPLILPRMKSLYCFALAILLCSSPLAAENSPGTGASFKGPLGLQMYSLRFYSANNLLAKLDKVHEYGITSIEGGSPPRGMSAVLIIYGLHPRVSKLVCNSTGSSR